MSMLSFIITKFILASIVFGITLAVAMYSTLAERKFAAFFQDRLGPNRAGPFGLLQPLADGIKFFFKEDFIPAQADKVLFILGPAVAMTMACMTGAVIPWGNELHIFGQTISLQIADLDIGVLYIFAVVSFGVFGVVLGGWASNNKYAVLSAIRASSQMISYELAMGLSLIALVMTAGSLSLSHIVDMQSGFNWNVFSQPIGFLVFIVCAFAETNRTPFDLPECEAELVGGYHTEYSSMKLGLYLFAEYINMFVASAVMSTLYFGGYNMPGIGYLGLPQNIETLIGVGFLFIKIFAFIFLFMWVRWTVPRFRYDQLMKLGWKILLPIAMLNVLVTGIIQLVK